MPTINSANKKDKYSSLIKIKYKQPLGKKYLAFIYHL